MILDYQRGWEFNHMGRSRRVRVQRRRCSDRHRGRKESVNGAVQGALEAGRGRVVAFALEPPEEAALTTP